MSVKTALGTPVFGVNWALAQRVPASVSGHYWVVPGNGYLCAVWQQDRSSASTVCETTQQARRHGLVAISIQELRGRPPQRLIVGIAPHGIRRVRIETGGSEAVLAIDRHGVFTLHDSMTAPPDSVTLL